MWTLRTSTVTIAELLGGVVEFRSFFGGVNFVRGLLFVPPKRTAVTLRPCVVTFVLPLPVISYPRVATHGI